MSTHTAELVDGTRIGQHGRCSCGRIIYLFEPSRSRLDSHIVAKGGWRHVSDPTSTMIPTALREQRRRDWATA